MMNSAIIFVAICLTLLNVISARPDDAQRKKEQIARDCLQETQADLYEISDRFRGEPSENAKCFFRCALMKVNTMYPDGRINREKVRSKYVACADIPETPSPCQTAYNLYRCFIQSAGIFGKR